MVFKNYLPFQDTMFSVFFLVSFRVWGSPSWPILKKQRPTLALEPSKKAALSAKTWRGRTASTRHARRIPMKTGWWRFDDYWWYIDDWWCMMIAHIQPLKYGTWQKNQNHHPKTKPHSQPVHDTPPHSGTLARPLCPVLVSKRPQATSKVANHRQATLKRSEPGAVELRFNSIDVGWIAFAWDHYISLLKPQVPEVHFQGRTLLLPSFTGLEW